MAPPVFIALLIDTFDSVPIMPSRPAEGIDHLRLGNMDFELRFCTDLLKLDSLHFGYWNDGEPRTYANLKRAQSRYTSELIARIPDGVRTVLDVGCGIGDNARALAAKGYLVYALSPDANHGRFFAARGMGPISFHNCRFEDFDAEQHFDLVLMSESHNYFDADEGLRQCQRLLAPGGYILLCGMFSIEGAEPEWTRRGTEAAYVERARLRGFRLCDRADITERVVPTIELIGGVHRDYVAPAVSMAGEYLSRASPVKMRLLRLLLRRELERARAVYSYYERYGDPATFCRNLRYLTLTFRRMPDAGAS